MGVKKACYLTWGGEKTFVAIVVCVMSEWTCRVIHTGMQNTLPCVRRQDVMGSVRLTGWSNNRQTDAHAALPWKKGKILFYLQSKQQGESCRRGVCSCTNRFLYEFPSHPIISLRKRKSASSSFRTVQACYSLWRQCRVLFDYAPLKSIAPSPQGASHAFTPERGTEHKGWLLCLLIRQEQTELQRQFYFPLPPSAPLIGDWVICRQNEGRCLNLITQDHKWVHRWRFHTKLWLCTVTRTTSSHWIGHAKLLISVFWPASAPVQSRDVTNTTVVSLPN